MSSRTTTPPRVDPPAPRAGRRGFTLVELMVVVVVILVLASLMLSGLAVARQRARIARTKSTIRKLNEIVVPHYESYMRRRVLFATGTNARTNATNRLVNVRMLTLREMPDTISDVYASVPSALSLTSGSTFLRTGPVLSYANTRAAITTWQATHDSAECLYLILSRGGIEPDVMEQFRSDEIGDVDRDGAPEFLDGWNTPIEFWRWAPGFSCSPGTPGIRSAPLVPTGSGFSPVQFADRDRSHDPFDPMRVDLDAYALVPLIVSCGPDRRPGLTPSPGWGGLALDSIVTAGSAIGAPDGSTDHRDNITNHDLTVK